MIRPLVVVCLSTLAMACTAAPKKAYHRPHTWTDVSNSKVSNPKAANSKASKKNPQMRVFYGEPEVKYKKVCKIEAAGGNFIETKYTKISDFEPQFKRRARRCPGANAVIIQNMFAFEHGSAFADGIGIAIEPES